MDDRREPKRARQACINCRRKKARCSGEKPVCAFCARLGQRCNWGNPSPPPESQPNRCVSTSSQDSGLAARVALLEAKLSLLGEDEGALGLLGSMLSTAGPAVHTLPNQTSGDWITIPQTVNSTVSGPSVSHEFSRLPSMDTMRSLIDVYFEHCHNQPYAFFHEATFRQSFDKQALSEYLLYAVVATACRFSEHEYYRDHRAEAISFYANASWARLFEHSFSYQQSMELSMVQATCMLAVIDFAGGHPKLGWVKVALAVRFAQGLRLNEEPDEQLPVSEQEERRRTFWSVYLLDRLISLGPNRPPAFLDEDCTVRLPDNEDLFRNGSASEHVPTLDAVIDDPTASANQNLDWYAMTVLMAAALGQFVRYGLRHTPSTSVPWDPRSKYYSVHSILLHFESLSPCTLSTMSECLRDQFTFDESFGKQRAGHFVFSHALFHLNHCLLNHPFILYHIFEPCRASIPLSFVQEALQRCYKHATDLLNLVQDAQDNGGFAQSSFYGYFALAPGMIHRLFASHDDSQISNTSKDLAQAALSFLERKPVRWEIFTYMVSGEQLRGFLLPSLIWSRPLSPLSN